MPFDLNTAMRVAGNSPDMYENRAQAMRDLRAQAAADPEMRRRMVTERARDWYRNYMGAEPRPMPAAGVAPGLEAMPQVPFMAPAGNAMDQGGDRIRGMLQQLRQAGVIA